MQDLLLIAVMALTFIFGNFLLKRVDRFCEENPFIQEGSFDKKEKTLRIGFFDPTAAAGIGDVLKKWNKRCFGISVRFFYGSKKDLLQLLSNHELNVIFLSECTQLPTGLCRGSQTVLLSLEPAAVECGGQHIDPIGKEKKMTVQMVLWLQEEKAPFVFEFIKCLMEECGAQKEWK